MPYYGEFFTSTQVFHKKFSEEETLNFIEEHCGKTFKNCTIISPENTTTYMTSRKGKITKLVKPNSPAQNIISPLKNIKETSHQPNREKNRILREGTNIPFLVQLGIMTSDGKIKSSKFNKFKQINRFLEIFSDILRYSAGNKKNRFHPLQNLRLWFRKKLPYFRRALFNDRNSSPSLRNFRS